MDLPFLDFSNLPVENYVSFIEWHNARLFWVYLFQSAHFAKEINLIKARKPLRLSNPLSRLNPLYDGRLLRVGGRLSKALLDSDVKHPLILPDRCHFAVLSIRFTHLIELHAGTQLTLATQRRQYWIIKGRQAVKSEIGRCLVCRKFSASNTQQLMGDLPGARVTQAYPFQRFGVDYAGPISVRLTKSRGKGTLKGYICIFVCMCTRAVHIELVHYSSAAFIAAFQRFVSRRWHCVELYSDCGTNFVGADGSFVNYTVKHLSALDKSRSRWLKKGRSGNSIHQGRFTSEGSGRRQ